MQGCSLSSRLLLIASVPAVLAIGIHPLLAQKSSSSIDNALPDSPSVLQQHQPALPLAAQSSSQPAVVAPARGQGSINILEDTLIRVRTNQALSTRFSKEGTQLSFTLSEDVVVDGLIAIPRGATLSGEIVHTHKAGVLTGAPELTLKLTSLDLGGHPYPVYSYQFKAEGTSKTPPTQAKIKTGATTGALLGGLFGGSAYGPASGTGKLADIATGAVLGAGIGTAVAAATPSPSVVIPPESQLDFYLASPISVQPVDAEEATRLSHKIAPGEPKLYVRDGAR